MEKRQEWVLHLFLSRTLPERAKALKQFLSEEENAALDKLPSLALPATIESQDLLDLVHWSWLLPILKSYPQKEWQLFLSALEELAASHLAKELACEVLPGLISPSGKSFLRQVLRQHLTATEEAPLPIDLLPPSPLNRLLSLRKKDWVSLINRLALFDLASELRQIVETKILKRIYSFLSEEERNFLKSAAAHKKPYPIPRMGLDRGSGDKEEFRAHLHRRGIARLGAALSGQDPDLVWYICHQLDIGRGAALYKACGTESLGAISEWMIRQMEELLLPTETK